MVKIKFLTNMGSAVLPQYRLYCLGVEITGPGDGWQDGPSCLILRNGDLFFDSPCVILCWRVHWVIWVVHKIMYDSKEGMG